MKLNQSHEWYRRHAEADQSSDVFAGTPATRKSGTVASPVWFKWVGTWSPAEKKIRLFRFGCNRRYIPEVQRWISRSLSFTIWFRRPFSFEKTSEGWYLTIFCFGVHFKEAWGGYLS